MMIARAGLLREFRACSTYPSPRQTFVKRRGHALVGIRGNARLALHPVARRAEQNTAGRCSTTPG